jgi:hypothetical protein
VQKGRKTESTFLFYFQVKKSKVIELDSSLSLFFFTQFYALFILFTEEDDDDDDDSVAVTVAAAAITYMCCSKFKVTIFIF